MKPSNDAHARVVTRLRAILTEDLDLEIDAGSITNDASLLEDGLALDSIAMVEFIDLLEERFDIYLEDGALTEEHFDNLQTLAGFIAERLPGDAT